MLYQVLRQTCKSRKDLAFYPSSYMCSESDRDLSMSCQSELFLVEVP